VDPRKGLDTVEKRKISFPAANRTPAFQSVAKETELLSELLGFWTSSSIRYSENQRTQPFGNCICFRPQVSRETPTLLGPLERANLSRLAFSKGRNGVSPFSPADGNRSSCRNVVFTSFWDTGRWTKSKNLAILSGIHRLQIL
jgi:hypothetical protein